MKKVIVFDDAIQRDNIRIDNAILILQYTDLDECGKYTKAIDKFALVDEKESSKKGGS